MVKAAYPEEYPDHFCRHCDRTEAKHQGPLNAKNRRSARLRSRLREASALNS